MARDAPGAALAAGAVVLLSLADGGYEPSAWRTATVAFLAAAGLALVLGRRPSPTWAQLLVASALAAFAGWVALSALWSPVPAAASLEAQRAVLYVSVVVAAVVVGGALLAGTLAGVAITCAYGLWLWLLDGRSSAVDPFQSRLLHEPLGYANALGGLAAIGLALSVGLLVHERRRQRLLTALIVLFGLTLVLTQNRGGWLAAGLGVALAATLARGRLRPACWLAAASAVLVAALLVLPAGSLADDLADVGEERAWYWHVAWQEAVDAPVAGSGAGTFEFAWLERQPVQWNVLDAHSLYLETLAELGVVGLLLLCVALVTPLVCGLRGRVLPAAAGGYLAFLVHTGMDWDWEMPAVTVTGILCGCAILSGRSERPG